MKIESVKQNIIGNYQKLSELSYVSKTKENVVPIWGLIYRKGATNGYVDQLGMVEKGNSEIRIQGDDIKMVKKPFFITWKQALKGIDKMLKNSLKNFDNEKVVTKNVLNIHFFPENFIQKLSSVKNK